MISNLFPLPTLLSPLSTPLSPLPTLHSPLSTPHFPLSTPPPLLPILHLLHRFSHQFLLLRQLKVFHHHHLLQSGKIDCGPNL